MKLKLKVTWIILLLAFVAQGFAKQVDTISIHSQAMNISIRNIVILPENYEQQQDFPVLYLLHGYGGSHRAWMQTKPDLPELANRYGMIIVCPDGKNSWYWDSPVVLEMQYETYVAKELVEYMDSNYKTVRDKKGRAITGNSMGGHGGLWLGFRHSDMFGACGAIHGGVDIRPFPENWEMKKALGAYDENSDRWDEHTVINQLHLIQSAPPAIIFDCGTEDFFFEVNEKLHEKLLENRIPHDYIVRPGGHDAVYGKNAIEFQLLFFHLFFQRTP
jgi:S-formylglutathione hydrolase FrmB